jgi:hypothetical protein
MEAIPCEPRISPEGVLHYAGVDAGKLVVVVNGQRVREFPLPGGKWDEKNACIPFSFAEAGHFVVATVVSDGTWIVTDKGEYKGRSVKAIAGPVIHFEGGRLHYAYAVYPDAEKSEAFVIVDGKESKSYHDVWPDTMVWRDNAVLSYVARDGRKILRVTQALP